jgi:predicted metal-dependent phosphoesterase TrpH
MNKPYPFIDLHTHSNASDGSDSPEELVRLAAGMGLLALALTDHDTLAGLDRAAAEARKHHLRFVRGLEIAVSDGKWGELHLLGLWMPERPSQRMLAALADFLQKRRDRNRRMLEALQGLGMDISLEEVRALSGGETVGRPHIALAMQKKGYVPNRREAFDRYLGLEGKAFVARELMSPEEGVDLLRGEGALVVLAHPCLSASMTPERLDALLTTLRACGLDAIEAYHSAHTPEKTRLCVDLAAKHGLLLSGGSDYHGLGKEGIKLGSGLGGNVRAPLMLLEKMDAYRKAQGKSVPE